ncbi:MAG TPA: ABC transporter permease [Humidesulfovibrio sp.]|uniref:ABC transporter permease n=1 Tax=Humidesulfovibrio sp. TaxID=2910988 RepID=UPI002BB95EEA|nr:ABC transporter permease [Humidesulfovibrio sp.]HWR04775.1 ABC transporter permease [Humidesulfovibrio sp.]
MKRVQAPEPIPGLAVREDAPGAVAVRFTGDLRAAVVARLWGPAMARVRGGGLTSLRLELDKAEYIDGAGLALLVKLHSEAAAAGTKVELLGLPPRYQHLLDLAMRAEKSAGEPDGEPDAMTGAEKAAGLSPLDVRLREALRDLRELVCFVGESAQVLYNSLRRPHQVRWPDVLTQALAVGVQSLPILLLIGFLMGLIMSFQSVITLQRFGGEIYVPNMLGLVMFREMGPLVTAILLAARSGSAFAAEIGTMHVNEELDALTTMGISPVRFLVGPRILASLAVVPIMTLFFNFASLVGGALVMLSIGFPLVTFTSRVFANVTAPDLIGSIIKIIVFSLLVAGVSCLKGLRTGGGASAVGRSTTGAVVAGLILITVADGLFAVLFYYFKF